MKKTFAEFSGDTRGQLTLVIGASFLTYANSLWNGFALDDVPIIQANANVHRLADWHAILLQPYWPTYGVELGLWRPFVTAAYAVQWAIGGGHPLIFHIVSVLLHIVASVLVYFLLKRLAPASAALAGALIFAVHPVHTEAVANVVGQAELFAAVAVLGACLIHASRPDGARVSPLRQLGIATLFAIAILTKENAVVLPGLLLLVDIAQQRITHTMRGLREYLDAVFVPLVVLGCVLALYLVVRFSVLQGHLTGIEAGPQHDFLQGPYRVLNALRAMPELFRLLVLPIDLAADYGPAMLLPVDSMTPMTAVGALLLAVIVILTIMSFRKPAAGFPAGWFLVSIITVSNLLFPIGVLIAERTLYLPSVAVSAAVAFAWIALAPRLQEDARRNAAFLFTIVVVLFGARAAVRNRDWQDTQHLVTSMVRDHPESYISQWTIAAGEWKAGRISNARAHFELAERLYSRDSKLNTTYADFLLSQHEVAPALALLEGAVRTHPYVANSLLQLGSAYLDAGRFQDALRIARDANRVGVDAGTTAPLTAAAFYGMGDVDHAIGAWRYVIRHSNLPSPIVWAFIARPLAEHGYTDDAMAAVARGLRAAGHDATRTQQLMRVKKAVLEGCYASAHPAGCDPLAPAAVPAGTPTAPTAAPAKAPVPKHTAAPLGPAHSANNLQNARNRARATAANISAN